MALLGQSLVLAVIGMGVVYLCLIVLMWVMQLLNWIFREPQEAAPAPAAAPPQEDLALVLAAAAARFLEIERPAPYIPPVSRGESRWQRRARAERPAAGRPR